MTSTLRDLELGLRAGHARLSRRAGLVLVVLIACLAAVAGAIERHETLAGAVDRTLVAVFSLLIPLSAFAWIGIATGRRRWTERAVAIARFGASGRVVTLGMTLASVTAAVATSVGATVIAVLVSHGHGDVSLPAELFTSCWIAALTAAAYACWFAAGATFFRRGRGRWVPLVGDFLLGSAGALGLFLPRGHAENLVGGEGPLGMGQPASSAMLLGIAVILLCVTSLRARN